MNDYNGDPIDGSAQFIGDDEPMQARKNANGETVDATTDDDMHDMTTDHIPSEVDLDELNGKKKEIIDTAARNPTLSAKDVDKRVNSTNYAAEVLRTECPEWYENVFKPRTKGSKQRGGGYTNIDVGDGDKRKVECVECGYTWETKTDAPRCTRKGCRSRKVVPVDSTGKSESEAEKATTANRVKYVQEDEKAAEQPNTTSWEKLGDNVTVTDSLTNQRKLRRIENTCETVAHLENDVGDFAKGILEVLRDD